VYIVLGVLYEVYIHPRDDSFDPAFGGSGRHPSFAVDGNDLGVVALIGIILLDWYREERTPS